MGFFDSVKKGAKGYVADFKKSSADNRKYKDKVKAKVKVASREAYLKQAQESAKVTARLRAKQRFNPSPQQQHSYSIPQSLMDPVGFSTPKQRVVTQIQRSKPTAKRKPTKKKKKTTKQRVVTKIAQAPTQNLNDIIRSLPQ